MWPNPEETVDLVTFTEEILNGKFHFLCSAIMLSSSMLSSHYHQCYRLYLWFFQWINLGQSFLMQMHAVYCVEYMALLIAEPFKTVTIHLHNMSWQMSIHLHNMSWQYVEPHPKRLSYRLIGIQWKVELLK